MLAPISLFNTLMIVTGRTVGFLSLKNYHTKVYKFIMSHSFVGELSIILAAGNGYTNYVPSQFVEAAEWPHLPPTASAYVSCLSLSGHHYRIRQEFGTAILLFESVTRMNTGLTVTKNEMYIYHLIGLSPSLIFFKYLYVNWNSGPYVILFKKLINSCRVWERQNGSL